MAELKECTVRLGSLDETERIYAAEDIGYLNRPDGVAPLLERLKEEPSRMVRDVIFEALIRMDADEAIAGAISLLWSTDPQIRNQAVDALRHKGVRAIPFLAETMKTGDKDIRKLVLDALTGMPACEASAIYTAALADTDMNVTMTAVENLGRTHGSSFRGEVEDLLRAGAHPMLISACLEALVEIGGPSSLAAMRRCFPTLEATDDLLLTPCLGLLGTLGSEEAFAEVAKLLDRRPAFLHPVILETLRGLHPRCDLRRIPAELLESLRAELSRECLPFCHYQALRLLGLWGIEDDVYPLLVTGLASSERVVRLGAAEALRESGRPGIGSVFAACAAGETDEEILEVLHW